MSSFPRVSAAAMTVALLATACSGGDPVATIDLARDGLTPPPPAAEAGAGSVTGLEYATFEGGTARFDDELGRPQVINFFAQWCASCVAEMPEFEEVFGEVGDDIAFVGISLDQRAEDALELVAQTGITYPVGWDPSEDLLRHFRGLAMPTTVFVRADGTVAETISAALDAELLRDRIEEHLG